MSDFQTCIRRRVPLTQALDPMVRFSVLLIPLFLAGCRNVPAGAVFDKQGWILTEEKLELPWVPITPSTHRWCFSRLGFTASSAQVLLEVQAESPFDPREVGGAVSLQVTNPANRPVYQVEGPLEDPCCEAQDSKREMWISQYYHTSYGPAEAKETFFQNSAALRAPIFGLGRYCVSLGIAKSPELLVQPQARVILQSGWK